MSIEVHPDSLSWEDCTAELKLTELTITVRRPEAVRVYKHLVISKFCRCHSVREIGNSHSRFIGYMTREQLTAFRLWWQKNFGDKE